MHVFPTAPSNRPRRRLISITALAVVVLLATTALAGCSKKGSKTKATTTVATSTTTSSTTSTTVATTGKTEPTGTVDESGVSAWQRTASPYRTKVGTIVKFDCPPNGEAHSVWGTNLYTDDSSVCTAAVQVGLITFKDGGTVSIKILDGADSYTGSTENGVTSQAYASWGASYSFPDAKTIAVAAGIPWDRAANFYANKGSADIAVECQANGTADTVWGTGIYTDDSSICTAAVHSGLITFNDGGKVTFHFVAGQSSYKGTTAHGVTSQDYGAWGKSFAFVTK